MGLVFEVTNNCHEDWGKLGSISTFSVLLSRLLGVFGTL